ncbi:hypothetical protein PAPYR_3488 [Paratrimastix pyriformis]|uniref:Maelstrom domain-containing protein n=1 Tax=Paratrimastix pyriformis TaxID=342808 RepID=A0ABQ8UPR9_9EUKA|nr:hypothetical protein PAPYR_3488 [Paratrimastix pyriformis]
MAGNWWRDEELTVSEGNIRLLPSAQRIRNSRNSEIRISPLLVVLGLTSEISEQSGTDTILPAAHSGVLESPSRTMRICNPRAMPGMEKNLPVFLWSAASLRTLTVLCSAVDIGVAVEEPRVQDTSSRMLFSVAARLSWIPILSTRLQPFPTEVGLSLCTLEAGEVACWHRFIDPGHIPQGCQQTIELVQSTITGIPIRDFPPAQHDYTTLWRDLLVFLDPTKTGHYPPLFAKGPALENASLAWLAAKAGEQGPVPPVAEVEQLLIRLRQRLAPGPLSPVEIAAPFGQAMPELHHVKCPFHFRLSKRFHCALADARLALHVSLGLCSSAIRGDHTADWDEMTAATNAASWDITAVSMMPLAPDPGTEEEEEEPLWAIDARIEAQTAHIPDQDPAIEEALQRATCHEVTGVETMRDDVPSAAASQSDCPPTLVGDALPLAGWIPPSQHHKQEAGPTWAADDHGQAKWAPPEWYDEAVPAWPAHVFTHPPLDYRKDGEGLSIAPESAILDDVARIDEQIDVLKKRERELLEVKAQDQTDVW